MLRRVLSALLVPALLALFCALPPAPVRAQPFEDEVLEEEDEYYEPVSEYGRSAADDLGDWLPLTLTGLADVFIVRPTGLVLLAMGTLTYAIAVVPTAITDGGDGVRALGRSLVVDQGAFLFTRRVGAYVDDRIGHRVEE